MTEYDSDGEFEDFYHFVGRLGYMGYYPAIEDIIDVVKQEYDDLSIFVDAIWTHGYGDEYLYHLLVACGVDMCNVTVAGAVDFLRVGPDVTGVTVSEIIRRYPQLGSEVYKETYREHRTLNDAYHDGDPELLEALLVMGLHPDGISEEAVPAQQPLIPVRGRNRCSELRQEAYMRISLDNHGLSWRPDNHATIPPAYRRAMRTLLVLAKA
jgi:hypothetical protein